MHRLNETLNAILKLLSGMQWHRIEEVAEKTGVTGEKVEKAIQFLSEFSFAEVRGEEVRITSLGLKLFEL